MGDCWFKQIDGNIIHLPVVGEDINTSNDPIPTSIIDDRDRSFNSKITLWHEEYGKIILDFTAPGRKGKCHKCGFCCTHPPHLCGKPESCCYIHRPDINLHACQHLIYNPKKWGKKNAAYCNIYLEIVDVAKSCLFPPMTESDIPDHAKRICGFKFKR